MSAVVRRLLPFILFFIVGAILAGLISPMEHRAAMQELASFPKTNPLPFNLRKWMVITLCFLPAAGALYYALSNTLDRYLFSKAILSVTICATAFFTLWLIFDLEDNLSEYQNAKDLMNLLVTYYGINIAPLFILLAPFTLLLGLFYVLGQFSASREIVAMTQTGRGVFRLILPLIVLGCLTSIACLCFNYHLAPWGEGYKETLKEKAKLGSTSIARNVLSYDAQTGRLWMVGRFPYDMKDNTPLQDITITSIDKEHNLLKRIFASEAYWNRDTSVWTFKNPRIINCETTPLPLFEQNLPEEISYQGWRETPWQLLRPGLEPRYLGIPSLYSWLQFHQEGEFINYRPFLTQWHYRWAQPWLCLVTVLLTAPLGIYFSRRGGGGGLAFAVLLCVLMLFSTEIFLTLGDSGYIPPVIAAWGTNIIFASVGIFLLYRRVSGRPIYQLFQRNLASE